jgi:hypothetical protein
MRHLAFVAAAIGLLAVAAPAPAGAAGGADAIVRTQGAAPQSSQHDAFSAQRRHHHRHWHGHRHHWHGHHHWRRHHVRPYYGGWNRCRSVWRPYAGWVRVCRW